MRNRPGSKINRSVSGLFLLSCLTTSLKDLTALDFTRPSQVTRAFLPACALRKERPQAGPSASGAAPKCPRLRRAASTLSPAMATGASSPTA